MPARLAQHIGVCVMADEDLPGGFLALVGDCYDAALDEAKWRPLAPRIAALFEAKSCIVRAAVPDTGVHRMLSATDNYTPALIHDYVEHYHRSDEWARRAMQLPPNEACWART